MRTGSIINVDGTIISAGNFLASLGEKLKPEQPSQMLLTKKHGVGWDVSVHPDFGRDVTHCFCYDANPTLTQANMGNVLDWRRAGRNE